MKMKYLALFLAISTPLVSTMAFAESAAQCTSSTAGTLTCMAGKQCECKHMRGSLMKGTPEGYRWDCGINRGNCVEGMLPAEIVVPYDGPESVGEGSNTEIKTEINN